MFVFLSWSFCYVKLIMDEFKLKIWKKTTKYVQPVRAYLAIMIAHSHQENSPKIWVNAYNESCNECSSRVNKSREFARGDNHESRCSCQRFGKYVAELRRLGGDVSTSTNTLNMQSFATSNPRPLTRAHLVVFKLTP